MCGAGERGWMGGGAVAAVPERRVRAGFSEGCRKNMLDLMNRGVSCCGAPDVFFSSCFGMAEVFRGSQASCAAMGR